MLKQSVMFRISVGKEIMRTLNIMLCTAVLTNACQTEEPQKPLLQKCLNTVAKITCSVIRKLLKTVIPVHATKEYGRVEA